MWFRKLLSLRQRLRQPVLSDPAVAVPLESENAYDKKPVLHTEHDIWKVVLDYVGDRRPCQLVCQAWKKHIRPHLMRSLLIVMRPHHFLYRYVTCVASVMEARIFRELGSIVHRVHVKGQFGSAHATCLFYLEHTLPGCGSITDLTLEDIHIFPQWGGLPTLAYKSPTSKNNLERLCLLQGFYSEQDPNNDRGFEEEEEPTTALTQPTLKQLVLFVKPKLNNDTMRWLQRTPTMQTLRSLSVAMFEDAMISSVVEWINHRLERLEHLELRCIDLPYQPRPHISAHPSLVSTTIVRLTLIISSPVHAFFMSGALDTSSLAALIDIRIRLGERYVWAHNPEQWLYDGQGIVQPYVDLNMQYSRLSSVELLLVGHEHIRTGEDVHAMLAHCAMLQVAATRGLVQVRVFENDDWYAGKGKKNDNYDYPCNVAPDFAWP